MSSAPVWLITGTSSGFGRDLAVALLERGHRVIATARNVSKIADLKELGAATLQLDVTAPLEELRKIADEAVGIYGQVDYLVNNAGYFLIGTVEETSPEETFHQFNTNLFGVVNTTRAFLPHMRSRRSGTVVLISSVAGWSSKVGGALYCSTKFAIEAVGEGLYDELKPLGIKTLLIEPGFFRTPLLDSDSHPHVKPSISEYEPVNKRIQDGLKKMKGRYPGDPKLAVQRIIDLVTATGAAEGREVPLRVALGSDAVQVIRRKCEETLKSLAAWEEFSVSTDFKE